MHSAREMKIVNLDVLQEFIIQGRLKPKDKDFVTIRDLMNAGLLDDVEDGVKLLANVRRN